MKSNQETFDVLVKTAQLFSPKFRVISKKSSWFHRTVGAVLKGLGINKRYQEDYWTTIGHTAAYDLDDRPGEHYSQDWETVPHEGGHSMQAKRWTQPLFVMFYQFGTPLMLIYGLPFYLTMFIVGGCVAQVPWWTGFPVLGFFALLSSPVPFGGWRARWEFQQYGLSIAIRYWTGGDVDSAYLRWLAGQFTGPQYFWMWPYGSSAFKRLKRYRQLVEDGKFIGHDDYFKDYHQAVYNALFGCDRVVRRAKQNDNN